MYAVIWSLQITPDVVPSMSLRDWESLGLAWNSRKGMRVRQLCVNQPIPRFLDGEGGKPRCDIKKEDIEELLQLCIKAKNKLLCDLVSV